MRVTQHARARLAERFGIALHDDQWDAIAALCAAGKLMVLARNPNGRMTYAAPLGPWVFRVVWCPLDRAVITVLPERANAA